MDEQRKPTEKEESKVATAANQFTIILDELAPEVTVDEIEELFKTNSVKYVSIAKLTDTDLAVYGIVNHLAPRGNRNVRNTSTNKQYVLVTFDSKEDLVILAHCILFEKNLNGTLMRYSPFNWLFLTNCKPQAKPHFIWTMKICKMLM